ncbi:MAG: hypothetical protein EHM58_08835 [Ignavibacteriae bacterium]|nr:MAG: hypothetical protein EHM58_08835 [Ignavibacteriota bacterium]
MKEIGGFFELELHKGQDYHPNAIKLNTARNALRYLIELKHIKKLVLPYYICSATLEPLQILNIPYSSYHIDHNFEPIIDFELHQDEYMMYVNYFGINGTNSHSLLKKLRNVIIDNSQAFFEKPQRNIDTIYSSRKFFGVSDGAYLYTNKRLKKIPEKDKSLNRTEFLLKRIEDGPESAYELFQMNEKSLFGQPVKSMSNLTDAIMKSIDYKEVVNIRNRNFALYHKYLGKINEINIDISKVNAPMVYPFLIHNKGLKANLIKNKIFVATYWKEVLDVVDKDCFEWYLVNYLVPLPIDQRYTKDEILYVIKKIYKFNKK